jgi:hypothetical protein
MPEKPTSRSVFEAFEAGAFAHVAVVPVDGFEWRDDVRPPAGDKIAWDETPDTKGPWLVARGYTGRRISTLRSDRLLRDFDHLAQHPTPDAFRVFANRFGHLMEPAMLAPLALRGTGEILSTQLLQGERLVDLHNAVRVWRDLRETWNDMRTLEDPDAVPSHVAARARRRLEQRIQIGASGRTVLYLSSHDDEKETWLSRRTIVGPGMAQEDEIREYLVPDLLVRAARLHIAFALNEAIRDSVHPVVMPMRGSVVRFFPDSLWAAIHVAAMRELSGSLNQRPCRECGQLFLVGRRHAQYCRRACKDIAATRRRRQRARAAFDEATVGTAGVP